MPEPTVADAVQALTALLRADLAGVSDRIAAEVAALESAWSSISPASRRTRLLELQNHLSALADHAEQIASRHVLRSAIGDAYAMGGHATALTVGSPLATTGVDLDAVTFLATDTYSEILQTTRYIRTSTKALIRELDRNHVRDKLYAGQTAIQAGKDLSRSLRQRLGSEGVSAIIYRDGSHHSFGSYAEMLIRTKTAEAYQLGGFNQAEHFGVRFMEIQDGPGCGWSTHNDTRQANGLILPLDEARAYPLSHPQCRRAALSRPDLRSLDGATPIGPQFTPEQLADAAAGGDVGFMNGVPRRSSGTLAPAAGIAKGAAARRRAAARRAPGAAAAEGPAAARRAALQARQAR